MNIHDAGILLDEAISRLKNPSKNKNGGAIQSGGIYWRCAKVLEFFDRRLDSDEGSIHAEYIRKAHGRLSKPQNDPNPESTPICTCPTGDGSLRWPCPVHPPTGPCPDPHVEANRLRLLTNARAGLAAYRVDLTRTDLTFEEWCDHAIDEGLDFANYLQRAKADFARLRADRDQLRNQLNQIHTISQTGATK